MEKIILTVIVAVAAAVPAASYFIGTTVEKGIRIEHREAAAEAALSGVDIQLVDYDRHLFNATATTRITIAPSGGEKLSLDMIHQIDHTPHIASRVIATVDTELVLIEEVREGLEPLFKGEAPLSINTRIFLDGHQEASINSPAASGQLDGRETVAVEWMGMQGSARQAAGRDELSFDFTMPGLVIKPTGGARQSPNGSGETDITALADTLGTPEPLLHLMSLGPVQYDAELYKGKSGMWHGKAEGSIGPIDINATRFSGDAVAVHIDRVSVSGEQHESDGLIHASGAIKTDLIRVNGFEITNATYDAEVENLDAEALRAWQLIASNMVKSDSTSADPFAPMSAHLPALVNAQPVIKINDVSVDTPMGRFALKLDSRITGEWNDGIKENPAMLASMVEADLYASVPRAIVMSALQAEARKAILAQNAVDEMEISREEMERTVEQSVNTQVNGLIKQGLLRENAAQLESHVQFDAGKLTVNGKEASSLLGALLAAERESQSAHRGGSKGDN